MKCRVITVLILSLALSFSFATQAFATDMPVNDPTIFVDKPDNIVEPRVNNRYVTRRIYEGFDSGVEYNNKDITKSTKKVEWEHDIYGIYEVNVVTGAKRLQYRSYHWLWRGYTREKGELPWHFVKKMNGVDNKPYDISLALLF
ncbi:Uncharacterised protein [uncultured Eubacterium sp.]|nr:Uncharacterised protein [uncultured Eubacterium sp.]